MEKTTFMLDYAFDEYFVIFDGLIRQVVSIDPLWLSPRKRHYRCNLCGPAAAGEIPSSEQEALYGLRGPRESI